ncbi:MAG: calcium/sodium antiporter [Flavobacteriales bacterium]|jgi:cation:H+ antiporter|nr:calcium/sodium antiporter [Flavobacteriales bacterium]MBT5089473.1 calcium/sodium antiporter [Flavobacteriales bacterium]
MSPIIALLLGFFLLFFGGELLVRGSVALALKMRISTLVVGMTVVSFATSAPELFVSLQAVLNGSNDIAFGNVIGSNVANITLVLGVTALIFRVKISEQTATLNYPVLLFSSLFFGAVMYYFNGIPQEIGFFFIFLLLVFTWILISKSREENLRSATDEDKLLEEASSDSLFKSLGFLVVGMFLLKFGADCLVEGTIAIAKKFEISERIIAVTVVAIGTSIPELATSIVAALKKEYNLAVGNLIGSNIFNILAVLGVVASIKEITIADFAILSFDYVWMIIITVILGLFIYAFSKRQISRIEGVLLLLFYISYLYFSIY